MSGPVPLLVGLVILALASTALVVLFIRERRGAYRDYLNRKRPGEIDRERLRRAKRINR